MKSLIIFLAIMTFTSAQYCDLKSCNGYPHTKCIYSADNKCKNLISRGLTKDEKIRIVKLHNMLRQKVVRGEETRGSPGPQAAGKKMNQLVWDDELADIAQHWVDQCDYRHDDCRNTPTEYIGQNMGFVAWPDASSVTVEQIVQSWYDEVVLFDSQDIEKSSHEISLKYNEIGKVIAHYIQFVWAETNKIGCGLVKYVQEPFEKVVLVCNYGPGAVGNSVIYETIDGNSTAYRQKSIRQYSSDDKNQLKNLESRLSSKSNSHDSKNMYEQKSKLIRGPNDNRHHQNAESRFPKKSAAQDTIKDYQKLHQKRPTDSKHDKNIDNLHLQSSLSSKVPTVNSDHQRKSNKQQLGNRRYTLEEIETMISRSSFFNLNNKPATKEEFKQFLIDNFLSN